jgi:endonuclease/exonuclease/phosphatase (EEP) superfamily protein YafD
MAPFAAVGLWLLWLPGQLFRDANWWTGICFYLPSPFVAALLIATSATLLARRQLRPGLGAGLLALPPLLAVALVENQWSRPWSGELPASSTRFVHWNVCSGRLGWAAVSGELARLQADFCLLSEPPLTLSAGAIAASIAPGSECVLMGSMAAIARGSLKSDGWLVRENRLKVHALTWTGEAGALKVFAIDISSNVLQARNPSLERLAALIGEHRPDIVAGDFNSPRRSRALHPPPAGFTHAYEAAGRGWSYTWPVPLPLWAIDQCIVGPRVRPLHYALRSTLRSDHRLQVLDFTVAPRTSASG